MNPNTRTAEIQNEFGDFMPASFENIKQGESFKLLERDGRYVDDGNIYKAHSNAYVDRSDEHGIYCINIV